MTCGKLHWQMFPLFPFYTHAHTQNNTEVTLRHLYSTHTVLMLSFLLDPPGRWRGEGDWWLGHTGWDLFICACLCVRVCVLLLCSAACHLCLMMPVQPGSSRTEKSSQEVHTNITQVWTVGHKLPHCCEQNQTHGMINSLRHTKSVNLNLEECALASCDSQWSHKCRKITAGSKANQYTCCFFLAYMSSPCYYVSLMYSSIASTVSMCNITEQKVWPARFPYQKLVLSNNLPT